MHPARDFCGHSYLHSLFTVTYDFLLLDVELLWGHTTDSMCLGYMTTKHTKPKVRMFVGRLIDALPPEAKKKKTKIETHIKECWYQTRIKIKLSLILTMVVYWGNDLVGRIQ